MCSICGGTIWDHISEYIWEHSKDRGRDDHGSKHNLGFWIGNHRATPTTEVEHPVERQPVGYGPWFVFNGIIANDKELGIRKGEADTSVLPRVLDTRDLNCFADSLERIKGSYAIACLKKDGNIYLACNYKPIWILEERGACLFDGNTYFSSLKQHFPSYVNPYRLDPYSVAAITIEIVGYGVSSILSLPRKQYDSALVICSAGLDSTAVAAYAASRHSHVRLIHFNYRCRASNREMERIPKIAEYFTGMENDLTDYEIIDIHDMIFGGASPLLNKTSSIASGIEGAEYAHEWVPARNLVMLSMATAYAEAHNFGHIYLGTNLEEGGAYPDNEEQFILDFNNLLYGAVQNGLKVEVKTPLGGLMKHEIIPFGNKYNAPWHLTWSCYKGGERHCGECGPCFMRKTAFERNGLKDPVFEH